MAKVNRMYKFYTFNGKDPIIPRVEQMLTDAGLSYVEAAERSGVSVQTFYNWFSGKTRKPQYATVMAVAYACGYKAVFRKGVNWL
jgi:transcriptional regulator with XRE-family HTH domain